MRYSIKLLHATLLLFVFLMGILAQSAQAVVFTPTGGTTTGNTYSTTVNITAVQGTKTFFYIGMVDTGTTVGFDWAAGTSNFVPSNQIWLTLDTTSGQDAKSAAIKAEIDATQLAVGTYSADINIVTNDNDTPQNAIITVKLTVTASIGVSQVVLSPTTLSPQLRVGVQADYAVSLTATNPFSWSASTDAYWLSLDYYSASAYKNSLGITPDSNTVSAYSLQLHINTTGLSTGNYTGHIYFNTNTGDQLTLTVSLQVMSGAEPGIGLQVTPESYNLNMRTGSGDQIFSATLKSSDSTNFSWTYVSNQDWLSIENIAWPSDGNKHDQNGTNSYGFNVRVKEAGLRQGLNVGLITFIGDNGRRTTLSVTVNYGTGLAVDPGSVSVDVRPGSGTRTFQVGLTSNDGQNFDWVAGATTGWLTIEPASGTGATYYSVNITIDEAKLSMGPTSSTVTFRTPDGRWATLQVNVNKTNAVVGAKVVPDTLSLTVASGATGNFNLLLSGMDNFGYVAATDQTWLSVNPPNATGANIYSVTGQADATNLTPGQYSGHIYFTLSDGHTLPVTVNLTVKPVWQPSHIGVNPANPVYLAEEGTNKVVVFQVFDAVNNASSFTWSVNSDVSWLKVSHGPYSQPMDLSVYIDVKAMALMPPNADCSGMSCYGGTLTFTSNLKTDDTLQVPVKVILYVKGTLQDINTERLELSTSSWMALSYEMEKNLSIPGRVFVLVEHKQLLPNQVWAYRVDANGENRLDLFSRFGRYTNNAWDLSYAPDARSLSTVNFGGFRLIGVEGDAVVRVMAGTSLNDLVELKRWDITIRPLTGEWEISDLFNGKWYKYPDLLLFSERYGTLQAQWGGVPISIGYGQSVQQKDIPWISFCPNTSGQWLCYNGVPMAGNADYEFFITRNTVGGPMEFRYNITQIDGNTITGEWQYRWVGAQSWSLPERFEMRAHGGLVIPFDATRNAYYVNGTVKGRNNVEYPVRFQVDTGAAFVLLDKNMAEYLGIDLTNPDDPGYKAARCQTGSGVGVGGTVSVTYCTVSNITLDGKVSKNNVEVGFGDWPQPALLGMTFLKGFSVTINSADKSMNIGP